MPLIFRLLGFCTFSIPDKIHCFGGLKELVPLSHSYIINWEKGEEKDKESFVQRLWSEKLQDTIVECKFSYHCESEILR